MPEISVAQSGTISVTNICTTASSGRLNEARIAAGRGMWNVVADILATTVATDATLEDISLLKALSAAYTVDPQAEDLLTSFIRDFPTSIHLQRVRAALGNVLLGLGDKQQALGIMTSVRADCLPIDEADRLFMNRGICLLDMGRIEDALSDFSQISHHSSLSNRALYYKAYILYTQGDYDMALEQFHRVDSSAADCHDAEAYIAQILYHKQDWTGAIAASQRMMGIACDREVMSEMQRICGESLYRIGDTHQALPYLESYITNCETPSSGALYDLGMIYYSQGEYENAATAFVLPSTEETAIGQSANFQMGMCYIHLDDINRAVLAFAEAARSNFDPSISEAALYNYTLASARGGRMPFASSSSLYNAFLSRYPNSAYADEIRGLLVEGYIADNNPAGALDIIDRAGMISPSLRKARQQALFMMGVNAADAGNHASALNYMEQAAQSTGGDERIALQSLLWMAECQSSMERYNDAVSSYTAFLRKADIDNPNRSNAFAGLAYAQYAIDNYPEASRYFGKALALTADKDIDRRYALMCRIGDSELAAGNYSAADKSYRSAANLAHAADDYALYRQATIRGLRRDYKSKVDILDRLLQEFPSSGRRADAMMERADALSALSQRTEALQAYTLLAARYPGTSQGRKALLQKAISLADNNQIAESEKAYVELIRQYPTSEEASLAVDDLKRIFASQGRGAELVDLLTSIDGAPALNPSEMDHLTFEMAEREYNTTGKTTSLIRYSRDYPHGAHSSSALYLLAENAGAEGDDNSTITYCSRIIEETPDAAVVTDALRLRADAYSSLGRHAESTSDYLMLEGRLASEPELSQTRLSLLRSAYKAELFDQASQTGLKLLSSDPDKSLQSEIATLTATALIRLGQQEKATELLRNTVARNAKDVWTAQANVLLAETLLSQEDVTAARNVIEAFIDSAPSHNYWLARGFITFSDILRTQGETFEADQYLKSLRSNYPGNEADIRAMIDQRLTQE